MSNTGTVETAAAPYWRLVPQLKTVTVRRPVDAVVESMRQFQLPQVDWDLFTRYMQRLDSKLNQIEKRVPNVLRVTFDELQCEDACKAVFEYCLPYQFDKQWWSAIAPINLQCDMRHLVQYMKANQKQLDKLSKVAKHKMIANMRREIEFDDGFVFREESWDKFFPDAMDLIGDHIVRVGDAPDQHYNWDMLGRFNEAGRLQVMTARCNGRLFAYMWTFIGESVFSGDEIVGTQTAFYADPSCVGLGMRLQRASIERLREKGISELFSYAGVRGDGPRLGTMYKRVGAEPHGGWYRLKL
jgi:GNAT superfamily N-acetyltransferase